MQKLAVACILLLIAVCRAEESEDHSVMQKLVGYFDGPLDAAETFASEWEARIESDFNSELWESEDDHEEQQQSTGDLTANDNDHRVQSVRNWIGQVAPTQKVSLLLYDTQNLY